MNKEYLKVIGISTITLNFGEVRKISIFLTNTEQPLSVQSSELRVRTAQLGGSICLADVCKL